MRRNDAVAFAMRSSSSTPRKVAQFLPNSKRSPRATSCAWSSSVGAPAVFAAGGVLRHAANVIGKWKGLWPTSPYHGRVIV